jgi:hypothetical protein
MTKNEESERGGGNTHLRIAGRVRSHKKLVRRLSCRWIG